MKKIFFFLGITSILLISIASASASEVDVLLIGSHSRGGEHWVTSESIAVENYLKFNGINYTFFDIHDKNLTQSLLDRYDGVIIEGSSMSWDSSEAERRLISENMGAGNISVFYTCIKGTHNFLNDNIFSALNFSVTGTSNTKDDIVLNGAKEIYNYSGKDGFIITGGSNNQHVGLVLNCYKHWDHWTWANDYLDERKYGLEIAIEQWMNNAFGVDARVTMPLISLLIDDIQLQGRGYPRNQSIIDYVDENKNRIRSSSYLVTSVSGHDIDNKTLQSDEEIWSRWGSISLHGYNHQPVGIDDYNFNFSVQNEWMAMGLASLQNFSRHKLIKSSPMTSFNNATLHAMYSNGIYYHVGSMSGSQQELYMSNFDVKNDVERKRMMERQNAIYRFFPLINNDETNTVRIYSLIRSAWLDADKKYNMRELMKQFGLDRWTSILLATHYNTDALKNPPNWITQMNDLMELVDHDSYLWRRWVDNYDLAKNMQRYELNLSINSIIVDGSLVTYNLSADDEIRYLTLKASKDGHAVKSVKIDGSKYNYFGKNYVHLPAINGTTIIEVALTENEDTEPHVYHIQPSAVIEDTTYSDGLLNLSLSGEFVVNIYLDKTHKAFINGKNTITSNNRVIFQVNASNYTSVQQINLGIIPSLGKVTVEIFDWNATYKKWTESSTDRSVTTDHLIGDFNPNSRIEINVNSKPWNTYKSDASGYVSFTYAEGYSRVQFEAVQKPTKMPYSAVLGILLLIIFAVFWMKGKRR